MLPELLTCTGVFACVTQRVVCEVGEAWSWFQRCTDCLRVWIATEFWLMQNIRSETWACKVRRKPELEQRLAPLLKRRRPPLSEDTWPHFFKRASLFSAVPSCFSTLLSLFMMAWAGSSSTNPQEALHSLIICTSNQGRHRDADHKSRPPPHHSSVIVLQQLPLIGAGGSNC